MWNNMRDYISGITWWNDMLSIFAYIPMQWYTAEIQAEVVL